jgi:hypothetical protein
MSTTITNSIVLSGVGLWNSNTLQAFFLKQAHSYTTPTDPRLPAIDFLAANLYPGSTSITVSNIALFPVPAVSQVGALRIGAEVIWYQQAWTANSTLTGLTRNILFTATPGTNIQSGNLISILGVKTPLGITQATGFFVNVLGTTEEYSSVQWNYLNSQLQIQVANISGFGVGSTITMANITAQVQQVWANGNVFITSTNTSTQGNAVITVSSGDTIYFTLAQ